MLNSLAVYIHWPFCKSKCPYCDFNSHVRDRVEQDRWKAALLRELEHMAAQVPGRRVTSIFFGGGTPSLMPAATAGALIERVHALWPVSADIEITLEANPTSVEAGTFRDFKQAGVNRVSLGVQSLRDEQLRFLGREHYAHEALAAVGLARETFERYSFDLIYARPQQTLADWEAELSEALDYIDGHMSLYQLTIEENTAFHHAYAKGGFTLPDEAAAEA
jgi:putative oxygen-independent coproporphyrinogen III oxidase